MEATKMSGSKLEQYLKEEREKNKKLEAENKELKDSFSEYRKILRNVEEHPQVVERNDLKNPYPNEDLDKPSSTNQMEITEQEYIASLSLEEREFYKNLSREDQEWYLEMGTTDVGDRFREGIKRNLKLMESITKKAKEFNSKYNLFNFKL